MSPTQNQMQLRITARTAAGFFAMKSGLAAMFISSSS